MFCAVSGLGSTACLLTLMGVPGMNWFLVATLAAAAVFGLTLAYIGGVSAWEA